jgi:hypothetical protein
MALRSLPALLGILTLVCAAAGGGRSADATTIYTYSFAQEFTTGTGGLAAPASLSGSFTGTADALGYIHLGTITDFHLNLSAFVVSAQYSGLTGLDFFSFQVGDASGSTLAFRSPAILTSLPDTDARVCVGAAVAALCNGGTWRGVYQTIAVSSGDAFNIGTSGIAPVVTLVSSISTPPVATTPIPGGLLLFSTALGSAGLVCVLRRRAAVHPLSQG